MDKKKVFFLLGPADYIVNNNWLYFLLDTMDFPKHKSDLFPGLEIRFGENDKVEGIFDWVLVSRDLE